MKTTVKNWFADKGYGFLHNGDGNAPDIIVHTSELKNCTYLRPGRTVEFECHINGKGLVARNVKLIHDTSRVHPSAGQQKNDRIVAITGWNQAAKPRHHR